MLTPESPGLYLYKKGLGRKSLFFQNHQVLLDYFLTYLLYYFKIVGVSNVIIKLFAIFSGHFLLLNFKFFLSFCFLQHFHHLFYIGFECFIHSKNKFAAMSFLIIIFFRMKLLFSLFLAVLVAGVFSSPIEVKPFF